MPGAGPPVGAPAGTPAGPGLDVDAVLAAARLLLDAPQPADNAGPRDAATAAELRQLLLKDPRRVSAKADYRILRAAIGSRGDRRHDTDPSRGVDALPEEHALLAALVLAARLPLDGLLLAAQTLFHVLAERRVLAVLRRLEDASTAALGLALGGDSLLALHHGLLAAAASLVPDPDALGLGATVVRVVEDASLRVTLAECRATSQRTRAAFRMLHAYLCTMTQWRRVPAAAELDQIVMLVSTSWEVPLPGVREHNEAALVQLLELANQRLLDGQLTEDDALRRLADVDALWRGLLQGVSWRSKNKYLVLRVLAPRVGRPALLEALRGPHGPASALVHGLLLGTADPHLASAATAVYTAVLARLDLDEWTVLCLPAVAAALDGRSRRVVMNVLNYWVLPTATAFPDTIRSLLAALKGPMAAAMGDSAPATEKTYGHAAFLHLLKIARKNFGLWDAADKDDETCEYWRALRWGLHHGDSWVRGLALQAVCVSARPVQAVSGAELDALLHFVAVNARADDTRLRHTLLEGVELVLGRVRAGLRGLLARPGADSENNAELAATARALADLHALALDGLRPGANYQRRVTCLGVYRLLLLYLAPAAPAPAAGLKKAAGRDPLPHSDVLRRHLRLGSARCRRTLFNCIMDPADDVRARAAEILGMLKDDPAGSLPDDLEEQVPPPTWDHVLDLCNSQLFFLAESGAVLGSVIHAGEADSMQPAALVTACERQLSALREDVLAAASGGSPLHGLLGLVRRLLPPRAKGAAGSRQSGCWAGTEDRLLHLLEDNVELGLNLLACRASSDSAFAPSFAEMGEAIESMISKQQNKDIDPDLPLTLSPAHQLVLNCIWLNLKVSCALASDLVDLDCEQPAQRRQFAERCARLPVAVLTRCRHKGAIESAGAALQQIVKTLTENSDPELRSLPHNLLLEFLQLLLEGSTAKGTSVSRRSAGMAILVHRIVLGDQQQDKPLLHECVICLFSLLEKSISESDLEDANFDLPQMQALHFLRTLIADAVLRVSMSPYLCQAALICFRHLNSPVWSVRNASLQLFGALVPKIVGQGKSTGEADEGEEESFIGCIEFGDLLVRFKPLCKLLIKLIETAPVDGNVLENDAELIPALSLLARLSVSEVTTWVTREVQQSKSAFLQLLSSPISAVRSLAAKAFSRFTPITKSAYAFQELLRCLESEALENGRSGLLTAMKFIKDRLNLDGQMMYTAQIELEKIDNLIYSRLPVTEWKLRSYASRALLLSISATNTTVACDESLQKLFSEISSVMKQTQVGLSQWIAENMKQIMTNCNLSSLPEILDKSLKMFTCTDVPRISLLHTFKRLQKGVKPSILQATLNICLSHIGPNKTLSNYETFHVLTLIFKILSIAKDMNMNLVCDVSIISALSHEFCLYEFGNGCESVTLPVIAGLTMFYSRQLESSNFSEKLTCVQILDMILNCLQKLSHPNQNNELFRESAAQTLCFAGKIFIQLQSLSLNESIYDDVRFYGMAVSMLQCAIHLLQDENSCVREQASKFVIDIAQGIPQDFNPLECLACLFSSQFLKMIFRDEYHVMLFLWQFLSAKEHYTAFSNQLVVENPFDHGTPNIFDEELWVVEYAGNLMTDVMDCNPCVLASLSANEEFKVSCEKVQGEIEVPNLPPSNTGHSKVREVCQANATYVQQKKMAYRLKLLHRMFSSQDMPTLHTNLVLSKKLYFSNFTFFV